MSQIQQLNVFNSTNFELSEKLKLFAKFFNEVSAAVFAVSISDHTILGVNHHGEELTGYEANQLIGFKLESIFLMEDQHRISSIIESIRQKSNDFFVELHEYNLSLKKRSKRRIFCDLGLRKSAISPEIVLLTLSDITRLKEQEMEILAAHQYTKGILDNVNEMILVINSYGFIETANSSFFFNLKATEEYVKGKSTREFFPDIDPKELWEGCLPTHGLETVAQRLDLSSFPVVLTGSRLVSKEDQRHKAIIVATDITERKAKEAQIAEQQMMLVQASKLTSLGEMAGSIAHEIHNPLQVISGSAEMGLLLLKSGQIDVETHLSILGKIEAMTQRISKTVHGLSSLSRDQINDETAPENLKFIIDDTLNICEQKIRKSVDEFITDLDFPDIYINCRHTQISQIILNLLGNGCDAIADKRPNWLLLKVELIPHKNCVEISVTDSGLGIPKETALKMFQPFFTTKGVGKGTGLGLSISKKIAESHGGILKYDEDSKHTRFVLSLPVIIPALSLTQDSEK